MIEITKTENGITTTARFENTLDAAAAMATMFDVPISHKLESQRAARSFNDAVRQQFRGLTSTDPNQIFGDRLHLHGEH